MNIAYFYMTGKGGELVERLVGAFPGMVFDKTNYKEGIAAAWTQADALVFVMATGIVVRSIAPYIQKKTTDPAVLVMDQDGRHVISLLSGHIGGANALAVDMAKVTGGEPVITTATDVVGVPAMDVFAKMHDLRIENIHELKYISGHMVERHPLTIYTMWPIMEQMPDQVEVHVLTADEMVAAVGDMKHDSVVIATPSIYNRLLEVSLPYHILYLTRRPYCIGTGCKKQMDAASYVESFEDFIETQGIAAEDVAALATIELKKDEVCIRTLAEKYDYALRIFSKEAVDTVDFSDASGKVIETSDFVKEITGVGSVSEACAWLGSGRGRIITGKTKYKGITFSLAVEAEVLKR